MFNTVIDLPLQGVNIEYDDCPAGQGDSSPKIE